MNLPEVLWVFDLFEKHVPKAHRKPKASKINHRTSWNGN
jgi:hypothetical protein